MPEFDAQDFGAKIRALRGNRHQNDVAGQAGLPQYAWSNIENGKIQKPAFQDVVGMGRALGLSPNEMAALAGLWVIDESEEDAFPFAVRDSLDRVRSLLLDLDYHEQEQVAAILLGVVSAETERRKIDPDEGVDDSVLPSWLRKRRR